jgi:hypothetical protein
MLKMKYMIALVVLIVCFPCLADDMGQVVEEAKIAGIEAMEEVAEIDPSDYAITEKTHEKGVEYYRQGRLILVKPNSHSIFSLQNNGQPFGYVVVNKDWSPQIVLNSNLDFSVALTPIENGAWELTTMGGDPEFLEVFTITSESVSPANAKRYMEHLAEVKGSRAAFKSIADSLLETPENQDDE